MYTYEYPRPSVTVDAIVISKQEQVDILLIQRKNEPFKDLWALPGGFLDIDETLEVAVSRELREETNLKINKLKQFKAYSSVARDPRGRTISVVFYTILEQKPMDLYAKDDAKELKWFPLNSLPRLAFDHNEIIFEFKSFLIDTALTNFVDKG